MFCRTACVARGRRHLWDSYAGEVVVAGRSPARFGAAPRQHGDLGAEVVAAADRRLLIFGV